MVGSDHLPPNSRMQRYPPTTDKSLTVLSAADRLLIEWAAEPKADRLLPLTVVHDRFGAIALTVRQEVQFVGSYHTQEEALRRNAGDEVPPPVTTLPHPLATVHRAVVRMPKSVALFDYYLSCLSRAASPQTTVAVGFMTRHFTPQWIKVAQRYAGRVEQGRARQKARLLLLEDFNTTVPERALGAVVYAGRRYRQYPGVFSDGHIDYATQFLLESWSRPPLLELVPPAHILDVACGNGVIGDQLLLRYPSARLTATDDFSLAVASARLNLPDDRSEVRYAHTLDGIPDGSQDLVVINPPFHFGYEHTMEISLGLFRQIRRVLTANGTLVVVANRHLNYGSHLTHDYRVEVVAEHPKYVVYRCGVR